MSDSTLSTTFKFGQVRPYLDQRAAARAGMQRAAIFLLMVGTTIALLPLLSVLSYVIIKGAPALTLAFFTELPAAVGESGGGIAHAIVGSLLVVSAAIMLGIPVGLGAALFVTEYPKNRLRPFIEFTIDILASLPSIVIGLFVYTSVVVPMKRFSAFAGAIALAILVVPIVARTAAEILRLIPSHYREAGLALGLPRRVVVLRILLRGARGGLLTGFMLATARIAGETAPLLFTALGNRFWSVAPDQPIAAIPLQIYTYAVSPYEDWHQKAWASALLLVALVFFANLLTRWFFSRRKA